MELKMRTNYYLISILFVIVGMYLISFGSYTYNKESIHFDYSIYGNFTHTNTVLSVHDNTNFTQTHSIYYTWSNEIMLAGILLIAIGFIISSYAYKKDRAINDLDISAKDSGNIKK